MADRQSGRCPARPWYVVSRYRRAWGMRRAALRFEIEASPETVGRGQLSLHGCISKPRGRPGKGRGQPISTWAARGERRPGKLYSSRTIVVDFVGCCWVPCSQVNQQSVMLGRLEVSMASLLSISPNEAVDRYAEWGHLGREGGQRILPG